MADTDDQANVRNASIHILKQAAQLKILPLDVMTLKSYCFLSLKTDSEKAMLWKVFMLLLHQHSVTAEEVLNWCEALKLGYEAARLLPLQSPERQWLAQRQWILASSLNNAGEYPGDKFYDYARECFRSANNIQQIGPIINAELRLKQTCYIAFNILRHNGLVKAEWVKDGIDMWHVLGFGTCELRKKQSKIDLREIYISAVSRHLFGMTPLGTKPPDMPVVFEDFFNHYLSGNLVLWIDPESKLEEAEFSLLKEFLSQPAVPGSESVADWSV